MFQSIMMITLTVAAILFGYQGEGQISALYLIGAAIWGLALTISEKKKG